MAFSLRKIISNIGYFKRTDCDENGAVEVSFDPEISNKRRHSQSNSYYEAEFINLESTEPDSTSIQNAHPKISEPINFAVIKGHSDTELTKTGAEKKKKRTKKLKLDIEKANQSLEDFNIENTPKHILLESKSSEIFNERMKLFGKSIDFSSDSSFEEDVEIESITDDDISLQSTEDKINIKMCRKVKMDKSLSLENVLGPSVTPESFGDVEETEDNVSVLIEYEKKFSNMEDSLKRLLADFQFHIEVSRIFDEKTPSVSLPSSNSDLPKLLSEAINDDATKPEVSLRNEAKNTKYKLKRQLLNIQKTIDEFINQYLREDPKPILTRKLARTKTFDLHKGKRFYKANPKKKIKHYDFPDISDAMICLFSTDCIEAPTKASTPEATHICRCNCHEEPSETDSGLTTKEDRSFSITSSIGNFSLDASALSAYSETLDQNISYVSYQDTSLYSTMLQKVAIERLTFYVQAHSIQIKSETDDLESKNCISFFCPSCNVTEYEENGLLKHILSQGHCEKIHFLYKTAYIKKCVAEGKEIMPSTVLNPMKMYRDDNKIVCFGDAVYACSLCFVNPIVGESVLMAHCTEDEHLDRKEKLSEIIG